MLIAFILFGACGNQEKPEEKTPLTSYKEPLINANKKLVKTEDELISDYIRRYQWDMKTTGTGLRYLIYKEGSGPLAKKGQIAKINYTVNLLTGELCYSSEITGPKEFLIGKGNVEAGIEEGILLLNKGGRAKFILPSHLAFGLMGDSDKIPAKATLVYDVELIDLN
ncbi:MAG: FKBP-type peptidyl-prolyl cis-trans isomerase [Bacteroidales bacterium]|nr:FKBP-type peptidyl-prolyl cis-trans isomerase [Bacteroidales bacterium]